jgi:hypothetical protein
LEVAEGIVDDAEDGLGERVADVEIGMPAPSPPTEDPLGLSS